MVNDYGKTLKCYFESEKGNDTTKTNRLGTCFWKPTGKHEEKQDEVEKTIQSTDKSLSCRSPGRGGGNQPLNPTTVFQKVHFYWRTIQYYKRTEQYK